MFGIVISLFQMVWILIKIPLFFLLVVLSVFAGMVLFFCFLEHRAGSRLKKGDHFRVKKPGIFRRLFIQAPKQYAADLYSRDPEMFRYQGCVIFTGRQGKGKTIAMVEQALRFQQEYPKLKVISNLEYKYQDDALRHWKQLLTYKNGIQGVCVMIDETQNWFSSNQSKNFPPEMLEVITQNRKNRRIILGTSQVFNRLSKPLREQATEVRKCSTLCGCITFVHRVRPELDSEGYVTDWKHIGWYFFVHSQKLRESYDTYKVIESLAKSGFQERPAETVVNNYIKTN